MNAHCTRNVGYIYRINFWVIDFIIIARFWQIYFVKKFWQQIFSVIYRSSSQLGYGQKAISVSIHVIQYVPYVII